MSGASRSNGIVFNPKTKYMVCFGNKVIETTVTDKSSVIDKWVSEIQSLSYYEMVVGLDVKWKPNYRIRGCRTMNNKSATLQLCIHDKCLIVQLFYVDTIPDSLKRFMLSPNFTFVGIEVDGDIAKLSDEYGLCCTNHADIREVAMKRLPGKFRNPGLEDLTLDILDREVKMPRHVCMSNWEARVLSKDQVEYACIDAYASFMVAYKLMIE